jgi:subtilisin family serine protease
MKLKFCTFGDITSPNNERFKWSNGLKLFVLFWMLMKVDVGWGQGAITGLRYQAMQETAKPIPGTTQTNDPNLNNILQNYPVYAIQQAFPEAKTQAVRDIYRIILNQVQGPGYFDLINDLSDLSSVDDLILDQEIPVAYSDNISYTGNNCIPEPYNDPLALNTHYIEGMNLPCAWDITKGNPNTVIAMIDIYLDQSHPDLFGKVIYVDQSCNPVFYSCNHGFSTAGGAAATVNNNQCVAGTGYNVKLAAYCAGSDCSSGHPSPLIWKAYLDGHKIINVSFGGTDLQRSQVLEMTGEGVVITAAASGNSNNEIRDIDGFIHVGAADANRNYIDYEGFNPGIDLYTLCWQIPRLEAFGSCNFGSGGTSMGAPMVAGVVALMKDVNPCLSPVDIEIILKASHGGLPNNAHPDIDAGIMDAYAAVLMAQNYEGTVVTVTSTQVYDGIRMISGDLILEEGAVLTIKGTVKFGQHSRLVVKRGARLILDGGKLTNYCGEYWDGIFVEGNQAVGQAVSAFINPLPTQAGTVLMINGAEISHARVGIQTLNNDYPWPLYADYWGGLIHAEDSYFRNNRRAVAFMRNGFTDKSKFINCTFDGHHLGVTNWAANGVEFDGCTFTNFEKEAIGTVDATIKVKNCPDFNGGTFSRAINMTQTNFGLTSISTEIENNNFSSAQYGVFTNSAFNQFESIIYNNYFSGVVQGVNIHGISDYIVERNHFINCDIGTLELSTGDPENYVVRNYYYGDAIGNYFGGDNFGLFFVENCLDVESYNSVIFSPSNQVGRISPVQKRGLDKEAGNCFTIDKPKFFRFPGSPWIKPEYYINNETFPVGTCKDCGITEINRKIDNYERSDYCVSLPGIVLPPYKKFCQIPENISKIDVISRMALLESEISNLQNQLNLLNPYDPEYESQVAAISAQILLKTHCLRKLKGKIIIFQKEENELPSKRNEYALETDFIVKTMYLGALIESNYLSDASLFLNQIGAVTQEEQDFVFAQNINIARLASGPNYQLQNSDESMLIQIGKKFDPLSGFARGVYTAITGEYIDLDIPLPGSGVLPRSSEVVPEKTNGFTVYPNPTSNHLYITAPENSESEYTITLHDVLGNEVQSQQFSGKETSFSFPLTTINNGLYILTIKDGIKSVLVQKVVKN